MTDADAAAAPILVEDADRVRLVTFNRPGALNAFNELMYDAVCDALIDAAADQTVAVVVLTGHGHAFCAGTDIVEMAARTTGDFTAGKHGFLGMVDEMIAFPKPLVCAVNGMGLGVGATMLGFADLVFMSSDARLKCPFTSLGVAPEAGSSFTFPRLLGRQNASWVLMSSEWLSADECRDMGLVWRVCAPDDLLPETLHHARTLAEKPITSLIETKRTIVAQFVDDIAAARERENDAYSRLYGAPANREAMAAFIEKRPPNFAGIDAAGGS